jgi:uncharacterized metal-binding protein YceD (DUF177 family)
MEMTMKKGNPFFVRIDEVPKNGKALSVELEKDWVAPLLTQAYSVGGTPARADFEIERDRDNLIVKGKLEVAVVFACSKCNEETQITLRPKLSALYVPAQAHRVRLEDFENDDDGLDEMFGYEGRGFSIEQPFIDALSLALDPYPACDERCTGAESEAPAAEEKAVDPRWGPLAELRKKLKQ